MIRRSRWGGWALILSIVALTGWALPGRAGGQPDDRPRALAPRDSAPPVPSFDFSGSESFYVVGAIDGDTISIIQNDGLVKVRLLGVDAPETKDPDTPVQFYGSEAAGFTGNLLRGERVYLRTERDGAKDQYGRTLAHVHRAPDGLWVNLELVRQGYGRVYDAEAFGDIDLFLKFQNRARDGEKGLWNADRKTEWERDQRRGPAATEPDPVAPPPAQPLSPTVKPPAAPKKPDTHQITVYVTRSGAKYHRAGCTYLRASSIPMDLEEAKKRYGPCSRCRPPG